MSNLKLVITLLSIFAAVFPGERGDLYNWNSTRLVSVKPEGEQKNGDEAKTVSLDEGKGPVFDVYFTDLLSSSIVFFHKKKSGEKIKNIKELQSYVSQRDEELIFATNGGMFYPDNTPEGLYVENGEELYPLNMEKKGKLEFMNFYNIEPNGVFFITQDKKPGIVKREEYSAIQSTHKIKYATQSGPMVIVDGEINPAFDKKSTSKFIRSGVGITRQGKVMFAISHDALTFYNFSRIFKYYGCQRALYLDGFISEMYLPQLKRLETANDFGVIIAITKSID